MPLEQAVISVRPFQSSDWPAVWGLLEPVFRAGETYAYPRTLTEAEAQHTWVSVPDITYVAENQAGSLLGTYYLKPNQPGLGSHVCNCGYIVAEQARGQGIATLLCQHSQQAALQRNYRAMQFNLVVSTNQSAVQLWQKLGFVIVGTLPGAFNHPHHGFVDAFVMYKALSDNPPVKTAPTISEHPA